MSPFRSPNKQKIAKVKLLVFFFDRQVGTLKSSHRRQLVFQYDRAWLNNPHVVALSLSLPLQAMPFEIEKSTAFFVNLLPEAAILHALTRSLHIAKHDAYGLLEAIGGECAGAISIISENAKQTQYAEYQALSKNEINKLLNNLNEHPMLAGQHGIRLSLAGAQNKLPIYYHETDKGEQFFLAKGHAPTSHIIKPGISRVKDSVINEYFCMKLAFACDLEVPAVKIIRNLDKPIFLVERYDRYLHPKGYLMRLHQEDFCQALGILPEEKYQDAGGPDLKTCFELIETVSINPAADKIALLHWVIFNYLIGNADSHAKNISLLYHPEGIALAPFYDLLSTAIYPRITNKFSMSIGRRRNPRYLRQGDWKKMLKSISMSFKLFQLVSKELMTLLEKKVPLLYNKIPQTKNEQTTVKKIIKIIQKRSQKLQRML